MAKKTTSAKSTISTLTSLLTLVGVALTVYIKAKEAQRA